MRALSGLSMISRVGGSPRGEMNNWEFMWNLCESLYVYSHDISNTGNTIKHKLLLDYSYTKTIYIYILSRY